MAQKCENCDQFLKPEKDGTFACYCPGCEDLIEWLKEDQRLREAKVEDAKCSR